jgi:hypothetical protein
LKPEIFEKYLTIIALAPHMWYNVLQILIKRSYSNAAKIYEFDRVSKRICHRESLPTTSASSALA